MRACRAVTIWLSHEFCFDLLEERELGLVRGLLLHGRMGVAGRRHGDVDLTAERMLLSRERYVRRPGSSMREACQYLSAVKHCPWSAKYRHGNELRSKDGRLRADKCDDSLPAQSS